MPSQSPSRKPTAHGTPDDGIAETLGGDLIALVKPEPDSPHMTKGVSCLVPNHSAVDAVTLSAGDKIEGKEKRRKKGVEQGCLILPHSIPSRCLYDSVSFGGHSGLCPSSDDTTMRACCKLLLYKRHGANQSRPAQRRAAGC